MEIDFPPMMQKRRIITGTTFRMKTVTEKGEIAAVLTARVWPLIDAGEIKTVIDSIFPIERATDAHSYMELRLHISKILLTI